MKKTELAANIFARIVSNKDFISSTYDIKGDERIELIEISAQYAIVVAKIFEKEWANPKN